MPIGMEADALLGIAAAIEHYSQHPLAQAIVRASRQKGLAEPGASAFRSITGGGVSAIVDGQEWTIGSPVLARELGIAIDSLEPLLARLQTEGKTAVLAITGGNVKGVLAMRDQLRPEAPDVVRELHALGYRTVMLTGDNPLTGAAVARQIGIDEVRAGLKPADKVAAIRELEADGPVLMVGDGVNDAPALAAATCGIAMGAAGTDAALEAADVALMADDLKQLPVALGFGRKAQRVSRQNIVFSLAVLVVMIPLAVAGLIGVALTVAVHEVAELAAVANGLRAARPSRIGLNLKPRGSPPASVT